MSVAVKDGQDKGASFAGLLHDLSDGGVAVMLDGGDFLRGTEVEIEASGAPPVTAWVCHSTKFPEGCRVGMSFRPVLVAVAEECWEPAMCRDAAI